MILFNVLSLVLTLFIIGSGLYYLFIKKNKNKISSVLGLLFISAGAVGFIISISLR
ncbi:hypothetical protein [Rossellomorea sp. NS-SX7]|uniref:hypothetical protein n=1 Tax=Rossellomorea sp. NS-SX7 TaxID=3463856 RepID=UPI004058AA77